MLKFGKIKKGNAIMARTIKAQLKQTNQYVLFCRLINKIRKSGITCVELSKQTPLMLQSLVSFCSMSKEIEKEGLDALVLALMLKKDQVSSSPFYKGRPGVTAIASFQTAECRFGDFYLHFGDRVVIIAA
jgi:hypothetical protein